MLRHLQDVEVIGRVKVSGALRCFDDLFPFQKTILLLWLAVDCDAIQANSVR